MVAIIAHHPQMFFGKSDFDRQSKTLMREEKENETTKHLNHNHLRSSIGRYPGSSNAYVDAGPGERS